MVSNGGNRNALSVYCIFSTWRLQRLYSKIDVSHLQQETTNSVRNKIANKIKALRYIFTAMGDLDEMRRTNLRIH